jgi:hypothetical protein
VGGRMSHSTVLLTVVAWSVCHLLKKKQTDLILPTPEAAAAAFVASSNILRILNEWIECID